MNKDAKNIEKYLHKISKNEEEFSVPENYFNSVEDNVLSKILEEQLPGKLSYNVPENYFETFESNLFSHPELSTKEVKVISLKSRILKIIPAAAAACMLLFVGLNYFNISNSNIFKSVSSDELELWIDENHINYSPVNSIEFIDTDFSEENSFLEDDTSLEDEDILNYLNTIDSSNLLTEIES